ncbi:DUF3397 family protein [Caldalkalibacillus mannanilyticus]|uniref:DUF3397 family protein n=1 Tax=Caldalkalibacillus mannanilyticus TaxID=1418 RepID=UPI000469F8CF|nr:DUF3397 family protein [Caldalkalibacillus mannanilyticus]
MLVSLFANLFALFTIFPILSAIIIYALVFLVTKDKKNALEWSINITTVLLLISVNMSIQLLWDLSLFWLILLIILLIIGGLTFLQFSVYNQLHYARLARGVIRLTFVLFLPIYLVLMLWVVLESAIKAAI